MFTTDRNFYKRFAALCSALMLEQAVVLSVNLADNVMLGRYLESALSGVAAVNQIQFILQQLVYAIGNGAIVLGTQYWGAKNKRAVHALGSIAVRFSCIIGCLFFCIATFFPEQMLRLFTDSTEIIAQGVAYLSIVRFSYLFFSITVVMLSVLRIASSVRIALYVSVIALVLNCSINYLLIGGHMGFPQLGVRGAAIGTLTARVVECIIVCVYAFRYETKLALRPKSFKRIDRTLLRDYLAVGAPIMMTAFLWGASNAAQTMILGHMNDIAIAAQSISSNLFLLLKVASVGAASAASILIGEAIGAGRPMETIKTYVRTLEGLFLAIGLTMGLSLFLIRIPMLRIYHISDATRNLANTYMLIQSVVLVTMSYQMPVNTGIIRGGGDTRFVMILDLVSIWGIVLPLSALTAYVWKSPAPIVIMLLNSDQVFKCIPAWIRLHSWKWVRKLTRETV